MQHASRAALRPRARTAPARSSSIGAVRPPLPTSVAAAAAAAPNRSSSGSARARAVSGASAPSPPPPPPPRAVVILPGLGNAAADYEALSRLLREAGAAHVSVAPVERWNWALNALALRDPRWWRGELPPRPAVDWYLRRAHEAVEEAAAAVGPAGGRVTLLAHSAGGWIGRVYLRDYRGNGAGNGGDGGAGGAGSAGGKKEQMAGPSSTEEAEEEQVEGSIAATNAAASGAAGLIDRFVSLGSPHRAPPRGVEGVVDQTRGILTWVEDNCPGAHLHDEGVRYVTIAGRLVRGRALGSSSDGDSGSDGDGDASSPPASSPSSSSSSSSPPLPELAAAVVAGVGYQQVCGRPDSHGDFIVPVDAAHLGDGRAAEVDADGVFHSPLGESLRWPRLPFLGGEEKPVLPPWYGHESVAAGWARWAVGGEEELPAAGRRHRLLRDEGGAWRLVAADEGGERQEAAVVVGTAQRSAEE